MALPQLSTIFPLAQPLHDLKSGRVFIRVAPDLIFSNPSGARFGQIWIADPAEARARAGAGVGAECS